jgi:hypothetical protein
MAGPFLPPMAQRAQQAARAGLAFTTITQPGMGCYKMTAIGPEFVYRLALASVVNLFFGIAFDHWVAQHQERDGGVYTAFYVVAGVLETLLTGVIVIGLENAALMLVLFAFSGGPMVLGSMQRHTERIQADKQSSIEETRELLHGAQSKE